MDIFQQIAEKRAAGEPFALATVVRTAGSSPRQAGARMLVFPNGSISGTIGGGAFEKLVIEDCLGLFAGGGAHLLKKYRFATSGDDATGMLCGGEAEVFIELYGPSERLLIFGGGHIGRDLARIAQTLGFQVTVIDERPEIISQYSAPVKTILTDSDYAANFPEIDRNCYIVIVTHGHKCDRQVLARVINFECAYIGMIGSKAKIAKTYASLEESGVSRERLEKVHAPIGLDIGAEGPTEIAVAVAAELVAVRSRARKLSG